MNKFLKAETDVKDILEKKSLTRTSDQLLFLEYWQQKASTVPFEIFFIYPNLYGCASFKTIERVRKKIQSNSPELKNKETAKQRADAEKEYHQYSLDK